MTLILEHKLPTRTPFALNIAVSLAVVQAIEDLHSGHSKQGFAH